MAIHVFIMPGQRHARMQDSVIPSSGGRGFLQLESRYFEYSSSSAACSLLNKPKMPLNDKYFYYTQCYRMMHLILAKTQRCDWSRWVRKGCGRTRMLMSSTLLCVLQQYLKQQISTYYTYIHTVSQKSNPTTRSSNSITVCPLFLPIPTSYHFLLFFGNLYNFALAMSQLQYTSRE